MTYLVYASLILRSHANHQPTKQLLFPSPRLLLTTILPFYNFLVQLPLLSSTCRTFQVRSLYLFHNINTLRASVIPISTLAPVLVETRLRLHTPFRRSLLRQCWFLARSWLCLFPAL